MATGFQSTLRTSYYLLRAGLNDWRTMAISLFTPVLILALFWLVGRPEKPGDPDLATFMFPAVVGLAVMLGGQSLALRVVNWRVQGVFHRFVVTPTPLGQVLLSMGAAQAVLSVIQATLVLAIGVFALKLEIHPSGALAGLAVLGLGVTTFVSYGLFIAGLSAKPDMASSAFIFTLLPMFFLGGGFPPSILPEFLRNISPFLPTTMVNNLLNPLFATGTLPDQAWAPVIGLLAYSIGFAAIGAWRFRWE